MPLPQRLSTALKEWHIVCRALASGTQILLLRKGGIHEVEGVFQLEQSAFFLFPTYLHQNREMLKPAELPHLDLRPAEPAEIVLDSAASVTDIFRIDRRAQIDAIDDAHIWTAPYIDLRFNYKPHNPLHLIVLRAYRLAAPITIPNAAAYAGCNSWVPLEHALATTDAAPALDDDAFLARRDSLLSRLNSA
jgi:hypothetical protein